ncbi:hypothetical protein TNCV_4709671 [Trichonephila clavipes]|nr:hypothetical protein TNCV_4709671 [Trichonephila clavipes]
MTKILITSSMELDKEDPAWGDFEKESQSRAEKLRVKSTKTGSRMTLCTYKHIHGNTGVMRERESPCNAVF